MNAGVVGKWMNAGVIGKWMKFIQALSKVTSVFFSILRLVWSQVLVQG